MLDSFRSNITSLILFFTYLLYAADVTAQSTFSSNLPIIVINTEGAPIEDHKKMARMGIIDNGLGNVNRSNDSFNDYEGYVGIEKRGSSSQTFPKKSFGMAIWTSLGEDSVASLLGMPVEEDWILYAPYTDKSLIRDVLTYKIANEMGRYATRTRFCEVMLNGSYEGIYVLMEKVKRDKNRVALSKLNPDETEGEDLTGGYIVKIDKNTGTNSNEGWSSPFSPLDANKDQKIYFQYEYPRIKNIVQEQKQYIQEYITDFEKALSGDAFQSDNLGYRALAEMESFIDYSIVNEIAKNIDGYRLSTFMHKDKNGKLNMGPVWDFNLAFGNADYCKGGEISGWAWDFNAVCRGDDFQIPFWWNRLLQDEQYTSAYISRWQELRNGVLKTSYLHEYIDSLALTLDDAQKRNFNKWDVLGKYIWPNAYVGNSYNDEVQYVKNWIAERTAWIDSNIANIVNVTGTEENPAFNLKFNIYPNPVDKEVFINLNLNKDSQCYIDLYDVFGKKIAQINTQAKAGDSPLYINMEDLYTEKLAPGIYFLSISDNHEMSKIFKIVKQ